MRIIAGRFKGRRLKSNPGMTTRPILDRAKQMLFDRLERDLASACVLDIFSGTGSMGLEALSRGASRCVLIEQDHQAFTLLQENVTHIGADEIAFCWRTDALKTSYRPKGKDDFLPYRVVFYDPPFPLAQQQLQPGTPMFKSLQRLAQAALTTPNCLLVLRIPERFEPQLPPEWSQVGDELAVGSMRIRFYEKPFQPAEAVPVVSE